ncbi:GerAB/ArcD/ProY family transporter [Gorillibacterium timonense]|uniref:GerAB/ArcD/ProY family transporter n=1 Tax=Gorillibacterium timonense TaxID=1689269 RepID=UPI00071C8051|nr:endospore germination permease [Gorillibacterium timonense]
MNSVPIRVSYVAISLFIFEIGSSPMFLLGAKAGRDAWLSMLIGAVTGLPFLLLYLAIHRLDPDKDLFELLLYYFGRTLGTVVGLAFVGYFILEANRNLRDFGDLTGLAILTQTPLFFIMLIVILVIMNTMRYGPRTLFLVITSLFPLILFSFILLFVFLLTTDLVRPEFLFPVLEHGIKPVWDAAVPELISFPFCQSMLFLVFFPLADPRRRLTKAIVLWYAGTSVFLTCLNEVSILVLGPVLAANSTYPILQVVQLIRVSQLVQRFDALFVMILFLGLGTKLCFFFMGALVGMERMTGKKVKLWVIPVGATIYLTAFFPSSFTSFVRLGLEVLVTYVYPFFQLGFPLLLFAVMLLRQKKKGSRTTGHPSTGST